MYLIDSHCHLDFSEFDDDRSELIDRCKENNIQKFVIPGVSADTWPRLQKTAVQYSSIFPAYGLHPFFIEQHEKQDIQRLADYIEQYKPHAIGEIGLDLYRKDLNAAKQRALLFDQLALAEQNQLPVILHVRKAHDEMIQALKKFKLVGGLCHAFNGSLQQAKQYADLGFLLGFGGAITHDNARKLHKLILNLPLQSIVLETDSPDMLPARAPSSRNTPLTLLQVLDVICRLRNETAEVVMDVTTTSIEKLLKI